MLSVSPSRSFCPLPLLLHKPSSTSTALYPGSPFSSLGTPPRGFCPWGIPHLLCPSPRLQTASPGTASPALKPGAPWLGPAPPTPGSGECWLELCLKAGGEQRIGLLAFSEQVSWRTGFQGHHAVPSLDMSWGWVLTLCPLNPTPSCGTPRTSPEVILFWLCLLGTALLPTTRSSIIQGSLLSTPSQHKSLFPGDLYFAL